MKPLSSSPAACESLLTLSTILWRSRMNLPSCGGSEVRAAAWEDGRRSQSARSASDPARLPCTRMRMRVPRPAPRTLYFWLFS